MTSSERYLNAGREFAALLRQSYGQPLEIFVFGSVAKGTATEQSDIDIAVIAEKKTDKLREAELDAAEHIMRQEEALIGCVTYSNREWERSIQRPFGRNIKAQGIRL
ncbi:MAG: nucleotidyltransferase domain-containing protein [Lentisphaerales bacterium]|jgi:predicted nucleotidyltransferase|nr:MAG: nucleotidyltransferase domain-containing protein [Lentisphaerales bacterium]